MKYKRVLLCICIALSLFVTGCWSRTELNELAIAVGLGIDKAGNEYKISIQIAEPGEVSGKTASGMAPVTLFQATGTTVLEAIRKITTVSPRRIYFSHLRIFVIGESLAREGIRNSLDLIARDPETRNDFLIVVAKGSNAEDTLRVLTNLDKVPSSSLFSTLDTSQKQWASTTKVTMDTLISALVSEGKHPVLAGLQLKGPLNTGEGKENVELVKSPAQLKYTNLAVFKKDKLIGWLTEEEGIAYNYINNHIQNTVNYVTCPDGGNISLKVIRSETKVKGSILDERPRIDIEVVTEANVGEMQCHLDLTKAQTIVDLEKWANRKTEQSIEKTVDRVQQDYKADIFGFGEVIHRSNPKYWKKVKKDWDQMFMKLAIHVKVNTKIQHTGKMSNSFLEKMKE